MTRGTHFRAVMILVVMAAAALVAMLLSSVLLWPPKAASAQVSAPPNCATVPEGSIAAWWPWEGNGNDIKNGNTATLSGVPISFPAGKVGQAMQLNTNDGNDYAKATTSTSLNVGAGDGLTIETWIKPTSIRDTPLVEWNNGTGGVGVHLWIFQSGRLYGNLTDTTGAEHSMTGTQVTANTYQHVALTYDKASGQARLYRNGAVVGGGTVGSFTPQTTHDLYFGYRPSGGLAGYRYSGEMDETGIFNRALTPTDIQRIYNVGNTSSPAGKCPDETVAPSTTASATVDGNTYTSDTLTKSDVTVNLTAEDQGGWGVKEIRYSATGAQTIAQQTVQGSSATLPTITQEGVTTVTYYATDKAGNAETQKTFKVNIDKSAPLVRSVSPVKAATNVTLDTGPSATFWEQMKPETFTTANVKMFDLSTKKRVPVKLGCDEPCTTVTIDPYPSDPSKLLGKRTKYKVVILGGAGGPQNMVGMPLEASYVWTFTTGRR